MATRRDRRHWVIRVGRVTLHRWCPGAPCNIPGVRQERHWLRIQWRRRG